MRKRTLVGPADWLRLCSELGVQECDKKRLLSMLGLRLDRPVIATETRAISPEIPPMRTPHTPTAPTVREPLLPAAPKAERNFSWIEEIRSAPLPSVQIRVGQSDPMPVAPWSRPARSYLDPLFSRRLERTILIAALARERRTSELDHAELLRRTERMDLHRRLPFLVRKTLRLGCQIIVDQSEVMELFREDQTRLIEHVGAIVPEGRLTVVPTALGAPDDYEWRLPDPGQPVLALSDLGTTQTFGLRAQCGPQAWLDLATRLHDRGSDLIVFFTGRIGALPSRLRRLALIIAWDHHARTASVDRGRQDWPHY